MSYQLAVVSYVRLENLPASGANVSANDFFQSFKLGCEAAGAFVSESLLNVDRFDDWMRGLPKLVVIALEACHLQCQRCRQTVVCNRARLQVSSALLGSICLASCIRCASQATIAHSFITSIAIDRPSKSKSPTASSLAEAAFESDFLVELACLQVSQGPDPFKPENGRRLIATS